MNETKMLRHSFLNRNILKIGYAELKIRLFGEKVADNLNHFIYEITLNRNTYFFAR